MTSVHELCLLRIFHVPLLDISGNKAHDVTYMKSLIRGCFFFKLWDAERKQYIQVLHRDKFQGTFKNKQTRWALFIKIDFASSHKWFAPLLQKFSIIDNGHWEADWLHLTAS